jgi:hypothetical protein
MAGMDELVQGAWKVAKNNDSILQFINGITQASTAAAGGAASAGMASGGQKSAPLSENQLNELFGITGNKVDASKLEKAWKKAGSPMDSEEIAKILADAGVDSQVIKTAFTSIGLPEPSETNSVNTQLLQQIQQEFAKLDPEGQQQILAYLQSSGIA